MPANPLAQAVEDVLDRARGAEGPLNERLAMIAARVRALNPGLSEAVDRMIDRQRKAAAGEAAPRIGDPMPSFALPDETGRIVMLENLLARGPVVISFNRGHWCPYCRLNADALARAQETIAALGGQLVVIVPERRKFTVALKADAHAAYPILTDIDNGYAISLNLAIWVGAEVEQLAAAAGWDIPTYQGNNAWMLPVPSTFILRRDGTISARHIDPDYRKRMDIDDLLDAIRALGTTQRAA